MAEYIKLEPHSAFKHAIVKRSKRGKITYGYYKLVAVCMDLHDWDFETAQEWVDFNIVSHADGGFEVSYRHFS